MAIFAEIARITLDGQGKAAIQGSRPTADTVFVTGNNNTIKGFRITGGRGRVHLSGPAAVVIDGTSSNTTGGAFIWTAAQCGCVFGALFSSANPRLRISVSLCRPSVPQPYREYELDPRERGGGLHLLRPWRDPC